MNKNFSTFFGKNNEIKWRRHAFKCYFHCHDAYLMIVFPLESVKILIGLLVNTVSMTNRTTSIHEKYIKREFADNNYLKVLLLGLSDKLYWYFWTNPYNLSHKNAFLFGWYEKILEEGDSWHNFSVVFMSRYIGETEQNRKDDKRGHIFYYESWLIP